MMNKLLVWVIFISILTLIFVFFNISTTSRAFYNNGVYNYHHYELKRFEEKTKIVTELLAGEVDDTNNYSLEDQLKMENEYAISRANTLNQRKFTASDEPAIEKILTNVNNLLRNLPPVPKVCHATLNVKINITETNSSVILNGLLNVVEMNPGWSVKIADDDEVISYIKQKISHEDWLYIKNRPIIEKLDLWRLLVTYYEGGMYQDVDRHYNIPLSKITTKWTKVMLPITIYNSISQDFMFSSPGNPMFKAAIDYNLQLRRNGVTHVLSLGPEGYNLGIRQSLSVPANLNSHLIEALRRSPYVSINSDDNRESQPNLLHTYVLDESTWRGSHGEKFTFYGTLNMKHWDHEDNKLSEKYSHYVRQGADQNGCLSFPRDLEGSFPKVLHELNDDESSGKFKELNPTWKIEKAIMNDNIKQSILNDLGTHHDLGRLSQKELRSLWCYARVYAVGGVCFLNAFSKMKVEEPFPSFEAGDLVRWVVPYSKIGLNIQFQDEFIASVRKNPIIYLSAEFMILRSSSSSSSHTIITQALRKRCSIQENRSKDNRNIFSALQRIVHVELVKNEPSSSTSRRRRRQRRRLVL